MSSHPARLKEILTVAGADVLSTPMNVENIDQIGYQVRAGAGPTGGSAVSVLYSNDYDPAVDTLTDLTKWDTYTLATTPPTLNGSAQNFGIVLDLYEFKWVRLKLPVTGGSGAITVIYRGKGL